MNSNGISQMLVVDDDSKLMGLLSEVDLLNYLLSGNGTIHDPLCNATGVSREVEFVWSGAPLNILSIGAAAVVVDSEKVVF